MPDLPRGQPKPGEEIERPMWRFLSTNGDPLEQTVRVSPSSVDVESTDGEASVTVYLRDDGVDVRVHDVQLVVRRTRVTLMQQHPPYPIERWTILWEGNLV